MSRLLHVIPYAIVLMAGCTRTPEPPHPSTKPQDLIIGRWESGTTGIEFTPSGSILQFAQMDLVEYRFVDDRTIEATRGKETMRLTDVTVNATELSITAKGKTETFKRVKDFSAAVRTRAEPPPPGPPPANDRVAEIVLPPPDKATTKEEVSKPPPNVPLQIPDGKKEELTRPLPEPTPPKPQKPQGPSPVIDVHMHVWSDDPVKFPFAHPYDARFMPPKIPAALDRVVKEMDEFGVTHCVLVQTISHGWDNRYLFHCLKAEPKRFRGQGLIDPTDPKVAEKLALVMKEPGMTGVRFSPMYYQGKDDWLNAKASDALWQKAEELGAVFNFFIASEQLPKLEDMIRRHPKVKVVIDHLARVDLEKKDPEPEIKKLVALAKYPNVYVKVSELMILSPSKKFPYRDTYPLVKKVYDAFGPDRLLWGTGFPGATRAQADRPSLEQELALIRTEIPFFTAEDRAKILGRNAAKVWGFAEGEKGK